MRACARVQDKWFFCKAAKEMADIDCERTVGYQAVYRVGFAMAVFFLTFAVLMIKVRTSNDCRAKIQNGYICRLHCEQW
jgi:hypothetical protein